MKRMSFNGKKYGKAVRCLLSGWLPSTVLIMLALLSSCKDFLDVDNYFDDEFKLDSTFTQTRYVEAYMWGMVSMFPDEAFTLRVNNTPGPFATDEGFINIREGNIVYNGINFAMGFITPDDLKELNTWGTYYDVIRICNTILTRMSEVPNMTYADQRKIEGYTRFFRAYAYYNLLMNFGPPILLGDEIVKNNEPLAYYDRPRSTYDAAVAYICSEFEKAASFMSLEVSIMDFGRPSKGAALALSSRVKLIHASPLFNGGNVARRYYGNWRRKTDDSLYISQTYSERRWALAAAAAEQVMELQNRGAPMYSLYTVGATNQTHQLPVVTSDPDFNTKNFPDGAANLDHYRSYAEMFSGECAAPNVSEFIWTRRSAHVQDTWVTGPFPSSLNGWGRFGLTQKMVDAYRMDDGRTIEEATGDGYYKESGYLGTTVTFSGYRLGSTVSNMYANREMRFYASVGFNQAFWECGSVTDTPEPDGSGLKDHIANYYAYGYDGKGVTNEPLNYSITGYVVKKWIHSMDARRGSGNRRMEKVYPIFRYAEILLNYAEALNNLTESHQVAVNGEIRTYFRDEEKIKKAFNQIRYRAGLPGIVTLPSRDEFQKLLERERMVEFMFENRRYFDVRRWGIYETTEREAVRGMNTDVDESNKDAFYQRTLLGSGAIRGRLVDPKLMFVPIPRAEIRRLPSLDQNPGWE
ncbi:MAG: RagB/SusD family nutrient uptake outer membrane protein [Bacteroidales bacterium]|jgi:hypothetical protein|nr:RagB/SusD family nutrient uptake outer membrane protein [Bacteroidales bacterium]